MNAENLTIGHEFAGVVAEVGKNVINVKVGDRVTSEITFKICRKCRYCAEGQYNLCSTRKGLGIQQDGAMDEYIVLVRQVVTFCPKMSALVTRR